MVFITRYWKLLLGLLTLIYFILSFLFISKSHELSTEAQYEKTKIADILNFNDRLLNFQEWVSRAEWDRKNARYNAVLTKAEDLNTKAITQGYYLLYTSLAYVLLSLLLLFRIRPRFSLAFSITSVALALLFEGVLNPMLEVGAFKEKLTVKAKVKPIETPAYEYGMDEALGLDEQLNTRVDSLEQEINKVTNLVHEKSISVQDKIHSLGAYSKNIPFYGNSISQKINSLSSTIQPLTDFSHPLNSKLEEVRVLKQEVIDSLISTSDYYASETYGIDKVFPGRTYFYYQNKGVFDIISILWESNNYIVALCLSLFSFLIPCVKLLSSVVLLIFPGLATKRTQTILSFISKWSMADVFVVGAFLSYLSFSNLSPGVDVEANVLFGLYFFLGYVLISIILGEILKRSIKESMEIKAK